MAEALTLAGTDNPTINRAREAVREARAEEGGADALGLPSLQAGANFRAHAGNLQQSNGTIVAVDSRSLFAGAGAGAVGTGPVAHPGVRLFLPLGEAVLVPQLARQNTAARSADADAVQNRTLLAVAEAYCELQRNESIYRILTQGGAELREVVRVAADFARVGQGRAADADRARANLQLLERQRAEVGGEAEAAAARLSGLLDLDPSTRLKPPAGPIQTLRLIDENRPLDDLERTALAARPEIAARSQEVAEASTRLRQERLRPCLPTLSAGFSAGGFGGGGNRAAYSFGHFDARTDFDISAAWNLQNAGLGNRALQLRAGSVVAQARTQLNDATDAVRLEVAEAQAGAKAAAIRREIALGQLATAESGYREESIRIREGIGRAVESLDSFRQLIESRTAIEDSAAAYNLAQVRLYAAVGESVGTGLPAGSNR